MTYFDWAILGVIALSVLVAVAQGFFQEIFGLGGLIIGYVLAAWEYPRLAPWFGQFVNSTAIADAVAFLAIFSSVMVIAGMAAKITRWAMQEVGLRWVDRLLGGAFGLVRGVVLITIVVLAMTSFTPGSASLRSSQLAPYFVLAGRGASWLAPADLRKRFRDGVVLLRKNVPQTAAGPVAGPPQGTGTSKQD